MWRKVNWVILIFAIATSSGCEYEVNPPSDLTVVFLSSTEVELTWRDNTADEYGFVIQLKTIPQDKNFVDITMVHKNVTSFIDTGLISGTRYIYRVYVYIYGVVPTPRDSYHSNEVEVVAP